MTFRNMPLNRFLNHQTNTVAQAGGILAVSALVSRILGIARDWLLARSFGAGPELDVYFAAFKVPDLVYNVLILGGVLVAFLPLFSEYFSRDEKEAWHFAVNSLNVFLVMLIAVSFFLFLLTPQLVVLIAPGFEPWQVRETITLTRLMFLSPIFFGLSSMLSGVLQYFNRFLVYSLCPVFYNLGIIFGIVFLAPRMGILGVALGVVMGAFLHFAVQVPAALQCGFSWRPILDFKDSRIKKAFLLMVPRTFGIAASQINLIVINAIASTLPEGSISVFNFANNIQYFPIGIIAASFAMAVFPTLSKHWAEHRKEEFIEGFLSVVRQALYLIIPTSILMFILRNEVVTVLLRHGQFSAAAADLTAAAIGLFCFGVFASGLILIFFRAFFALQDTRTPTQIAVISMAVNIVLSLALTGILENNNFLHGFLIESFNLPNVQGISVLGLPLAFSISSIFQLILLVIFFGRKAEKPETKNISSFLVKIFLASLVMAVVSIAVSDRVSSALDAGTLEGALSKAAAVSIIGFLVYEATNLVLGLEEAKEVIFLFRKS